MTIVISGEKAIEALRAVVEQTGPDFVYEDTCLYADNGSASCGVGRALEKLGVDVRVLEALDEPVYGTAIGSTWTRSILADHDVRISETAFQVFLTFQRYQDDKHSYGYALSNAEYRWSRSLS